MPPEPQAPRPALWRPAFEWLVLGDPRESGVRREQAQFVADAELGEDRVDGGYLDAALAGAVAKLGRLVMVVPIGAQEGEGREARHDRPLIAGPVEALKQLLVDEPCGRDQLSLRERALEGAHLGRVGRPVAAQGQGPDARVDEEAQPRERSRL